MWWVVLILDLRLNLVLLYILWMNPPWYFPPKFVLDSFVYVHAYSSPSITTAIDLTAPDVLLRLLEMINNWLLK